MTRHGRNRVCILAVMLLGVEAKAAASEPRTQPYEAIAKRNVFDLKQPETARPRIEPAPIPKITLMGITTILGDKRVLLKVQMPSKPGESAKEQVFILTEGQSAGQIKILQVDEKAGSVRVNNFGTEMLLTF